MINKFKDFISETVQYSNSKNDIELFFKDINKIGYSNPHISNEFIILDYIGVEFKLYEDVMYIMSMKSYDIRKEKTTQALQNIIDLANTCNLKLGINPFPFKESNMNSIELNNLYTSLKFQLDKGKWIKYPN